MSEQMPRLPLSSLESLLERCLGCFEPKAPMEGWNPLTLVFLEHFKEPETGFQPKDINL